MEVWTCKNFQGHWPVGTAAVVVASDVDDARRKLGIFLDNIGLPQGSGDDLELVHLPLDGTESVRILRDGDY